MLCTFERRKEGGCTKGGSWDFSHDISDEIRKKDAAGRPDYKVNGQPSGANFVETAAAGAAAAAAAGQADGAMVGLPTGAADENNEAPAGTTDNGCHNGYGTLKTLARAIIALSASGAHEAAIANLSHAAARLTSDLNSLNFSVAPSVQNVSDRREIAQSWQGRFSERVRKL